MDTKIILSATWVVLMTIYFLGDILRIISGDTARGLAGQNLNQWMYLAMAILMLIPILMIFLTLVLPQPISRWANLIVAVFFILFNLIGLPTYPSLYDKFLLVVSMVFNGITIWYAWNWA
ncbi:MAG: hypothetical protein JW987_01730 [Anaerolineaceae bacterium]|nr:hypothetical protein [Anaerolineaceae bacterium]